MNNLDYGIIGNCKSAALVSKQGSLDFCCLPEFDSMAFFAKLLDNKRGGHFAVNTVGKYRITQKYVEKTNILATRFANGPDIFEIRDFMPRYIRRTGSYNCPPDVIRFFKHISGKPRIKLDYQPRPVYGHYEPSITVNNNYIKASSSNGTYESLYLYSDLDLEKIRSGDVIELTQDSFVLVSYNQKIVLPSIDSVRLRYYRTLSYWMSWVDRTHELARYNKEVERSLLVLKLLACQNSGAILAAATTSLPETIGEVRNWDYRYCWIRDASMTVSVLIRMGHKNVAKRFLHFILDIVPFKDQKIQIMYGPRGEKRLTEKTLDWLEGYEGSKPVRIGNAAYLQKQNDIYGVLVDVIYQSLVNYQSDIENLNEIWTVVRTLARYVEKNWKKKDKGIWEYRSEKKHFTFSRILCWVAMDRAIKIASFFRKDEIARPWIKLRDEIKAEIMKRGCCKHGMVFTQSYGDKHLDASNLLAEHYGFVTADDPVYVNTVRETYKQLCRDGLMYRYKNPDDFGKPKSSFTVCTFWMIKSLWQIGEKETAQKMFDDVLKHSNHLGLLSEDMDFETKRLLGNFPQAYSHLALIDTAITLSGGDMNVSRKIFNR
ncbi:Trehalase [Limihaloglobus sulfuriphilus]|uniref:Trehalase n=1 Tax=Limihaloglobus sulfuriphilus TaxID=1851148 RepID=A0A1Q2MC74_9BACT|nr:glycoside hydrolase family 15 protein [Limihaloglobus sulfuriphilus]AQQ70306.1 Trehalase [Limihaloglobus sulfuriphilus]